MALPLRFGRNMRCSRSFLSLLLVLATPAAVGAETIIYFVGRPMEVPPPLVLLVGGLALLAVGAGLRKWLSRTQSAPESGLTDDVNYSPTGAPLVAKIPQLPDDAAGSVDLSTIGPDAKREAPAADRSRRQRISCL